MLVEVTKIQFEKIYKYVSTRHKQIESKKLSELT